MVKVWNWAWTIVTFMVLIPTIYVVQALLTPFELVRYCIRHKTTNPAGCWREYAESMIGGYSKWLNIQ